MDSFDDNVDEFYKVPLISPSGKKAFLAIGCLVIALLVFSKYLVFDQAIIVSLFLFFLIGVGCGYGIKEVNNKQLKRTLVIAALLIFIFTMIGILFGWLLESMFLIVDIVMIGFWLGDTLSMNYVDE